MRKRSITLLVVTVGLLALVVGQASGAARHASAAKTVTVVMRDPGCHWFTVGGKFVTKLSVKGPIALANFDMKALKVAGPSGVKVDRVGKKLTLARGSYRITMVGQASDDNILKLIVK
jgi:hypothetical protein